MEIRFARRTVLLGLMAAIPAAADGANRHAIPEGHPRLLGSRRVLARMAGERPAEYKRTANVARRGSAGDHEKMISMALVSAIENDRSVGREAVRMAMKRDAGTGGDRPTRS